jgi:hypothetical protein
MYKKPEEEETTMIKLPNSPSSLICFKMRFSIAEALEVGADFSGIR